MGIFDLKMRNHKSFKWNLIFANLILNFLFFHLTPNSRHKKFSFAHFWPEKALFGVLENWSALAKKDKRAPVHKCGKRKCRLFVGWCVQELSFGKVEYSQPQLAKIKLFWLLWRWLNILELFIRCQIHTFFALFFYSTSISSSITLLCVLYLIFANFNS